MMTAKQIHEQAAAIVNGDRQADYGHPRDNHGCTADLWTVYINRRLGIEIIIEPRDVCMLNVLQKISRDANKRKDDNLTDIVGYALNAAMINEPSAPPSDRTTERPDSTTADGAAVRCFEWVDSQNSIPIMNALVRFSDGVLNGGIKYNGKDAAGEDLTNCSTSKSWREFPPAEWSAKVEAVKSAAQPIATPAAQPVAGAADWPKWTQTCGSVYLWSASDAPGLYYTIPTDRQWDVTCEAMKEYANLQPLTRADAVHLIGESAVREGERLAGVGQ